MKKKGFTLIELLAVIVILAVIALIAVPIVLNIIEKARKGAAKSSALAYIKAVETYNAVSMLDKNAKRLDKNIKYNCTKETIVDSSNTLAINEYVFLKGYMPTGSKDYIMLNSSKTVEEGQLTINGYFIVIKEGKIISIEKGSYVDVEKIELNYTKQTMEKGSTFKLSAIFTPKNASDQRVSYASSNESVATVNEEGIVTAVNNGNAKIIVTSKDNTSKKAECNITVITSATGVTVNPSTAEVKIGSTVQLTGTIEPGEATTNALTWSSSNDNIAHVDENGLVTGMSVGTATIKARTVNGKEATSIITVKEIEATSVSLNKTSATIALSGTVQLNATISPSNTTNKTLTWTSSNTSVATVSDNGLVTGKAEGTSTITVKTSNGISATATIYVKDFTGIQSLTYTVNQAVTYQGISFLVVKDNGDTVTLVTANDIGTGAYGSNTTFAGSTAYNYVNTTWVNNNSGIKNEIAKDGIITDPTTNSKVRLLTKSEAPGKTNGTGNTFWTMTPSGSNMYYAKSNGGTSYDYVSGGSISSASTVTAPTSTSGRVDDSYSRSKSSEYDGCIYSCQNNCLYEENESGCLRSCSKECSGKSTSYYPYVRNETNTKPIGYRPVITVRKK